MTRDPAERPEFAVVPFVVGSRMERAFQAAAAAGVVLAQPDPDGPPLRVLVWGRRVRVVTQAPPAGTVVRWNHSVVVAWVDEEAGGVREPRRPPSPVDRDQAPSPSPRE